MRERIDPHPEAIDANQMSSKVPRKTQFVYTLNFRAFVFLSALVKPIKVIEFRRLISFERKESTKNKRVPKKDGT